MSEWLLCNKKVLCIEISRQIVREDVADAGSGAGVQWGTLTPIQLPGLMGILYLKVKFLAQGPAVIIRN